MREESAETWGHGDLGLSNRVSPMAGGLRVTGIPPLCCTLAQPGNLGSPGPAKAMLLNFPTKLALFLPLVGSLV